MAAEFVFGDMICYREDPTGHDGPIMYVGPCNHTGWLPGNIDMLTIPEGDTDCKDPAMWRKCTHLVDADGYLPGENPKDHGITDSFSRAEREVRVLVDGKELDSADYTYDGMQVKVHKPIWGDVRVEYVDDGSVKWIGRFP